VPSKRQVLALFLVVTCGLVASACLSPTLPLPPPSRPVIEGPDEQGNVTLSGNVIPEAEVYAHNTETDRIDGQLTSSSESPSRSSERRSVWPTYAIALIVCDDWTTAKAAKSAKTRQGLDLIDVTRRSETKIILAVLAVLAALAVNLPLSNAIPV
jgi:hypothetical protein